MEALKAKFPNHELTEDANGNIILKVEPKAYLDTLAVAKELGFIHASSLTAKDTKESLVLVVHLFKIDFDQPQKGLVVQVELLREGAKVPTAVNLYPALNWYEREAYDMFGIAFEGHPNPVRILLPDEWQGGHPLLKDFVDKRPVKPRLVRER